jgi:quercetin dioxygenase-like cupin family protein
VNQSEFEAKMRADGFVEIVTREREPSEPSDEHAHEFTARVMVLDGELALTLSGTRHVYRSGDSCEVPAGTTHIEHYGPNGASVRYIAGRRAA